MAAALNFWTSIEITTEKNSETTGFCIRCEMCVSGSFLHPLQPHQQIEQQFCACKENIFEQGDCSPGFAALPAGCPVSPRADVLCRWEGAVV